jgi:chromosome segregation protein
MRLESVVLQGFKSFADKTTLTVYPGITAIVGPNGCGKSNISEAIRWALGEQSAKSLRGTRMEDLIFHGSASRKPVGLADVELRFANDGTLALPWSEVSVGRRLYRSGESEYVLNRNACRLRDILDLFAGTGASPRAYSVMDQDKLNHVLTAKPFERRVFIEEAAGIARYKQQRGETQGKLDLTRQNLLRVRDVMEEVRRHLAMLERQARKAKEYKELQTERQALALALLAADYRGLLDEGGRLEAELAEVRARASQLEVRSAALAARQAQGRERLDETAEQLAGVRQRAQGAQGEVERLLERCAQMGIQLGGLTAEDMRLTEELRLLQERRAAVLSDRETTTASLEAAEALAAARGHDADALGRVLDAHREALGAERARLEALRLEQVRVAAERADLTRSAGELRERRAQLERREGRLSQEREAAEREAGALGARRNELNAAHARTLAALSALREQDTDVERLLADREPRLASAQARLAEIRVTLAARQSSLESLERLERAREGYGAGVRAMFSADGTPRVAGILGTVADLLEVPADLDAAIEAVLRDRLQWIVVEQFRDAREAVSVLAREAAGAATFLPLETLPAAGEVVAGGDGLRWAAAAVAAARPELLHYLLGRVAIVDQLDEAERLWRRNGVVATYVTPAGEVLSPVGRLTGGRGTDGGQGESESSLLQRKRTLRVLAAEVAQLEAELDGARAAVADLQTEVSALRVRLPHLREAIQVAEAARLAGEKDVEVSGHEQERIARHIDLTTTELAQILAERAETTQTLEQLGRRLDVIRDAEDAHERGMAGLRLSIETAQASETAAVTELTACRVEVAAASERVEALRRELVQLANAERDLRARADQAQVRQAQVRERTVGLEAERAQTDAAAREVSAGRDRLEAEERIQAQRHETAVSELRAIEAEAREVQTELGRLGSVAHGFELRATADRVRREEVEQDARRTFGLASGADLAERFDPALDVPAARIKVAAQDEKLAAFGAVNLVADEEYRELDERLAFLRAQHDDLVSSMKDLERALRGMTKTAQDRFHRAFEDINKQFGEIFERLFEGGRAELRLVEPEDGGDPLEAGVELMAQPRGKRLQTVTLMSGGERALTGLALLFAIFYHRPSPFCVLDEVDAPLDDANIHRFLRVLRELCARTQFLVITHNRKTMEAADVLYGVTMGEPGLSRLVSVNLAHVPA